MDVVKIVMAKATVRILKPLVRILMRIEISHGEFVELAKQAYVDAAYKYFYIQSRKTTYSRVAVLTGLSGKEVVRLSKMGEEEVPLQKAAFNRATRVIGGWLRDKMFLDENNNPKELPMRGDTASFQELVSRYGGDVTLGAVLDELIRVGAVMRPD